MSGSPKLYVESFTPEYPVQHAASIRCWRQEPQERERPSCRGLRGGLRGPAKDARLQCRKVEPSAARALENPGSECACSVHAIYYFLFINSLAPIHGFPRHHVCGYHMAALPFIFLDRGPVVAGLVFGSW